MKNENGKVVTGLEKAGIQDFPVSIDRVLLDAIGAAGVKPNTCLFTMSPVLAGVELEYSPCQVFTLSPGESMTFYASGPRGTTVHVMASSQSTSSSHEHNSSRFIKVSPGNLRLDSDFPQNVPVSITVPATYGIYNLTAEFRAGNPRTHRHQFVVRANGRARLSVNRDFPGKISHSYTN